MTTLGARLKEAREAAGYAHADIANMIGVRPATFKNWENGKGEPRANRLPLLAGALHVSVRWLLSGEGDGAGAASADGPSRSDVSALLEEVRAARDAAQNLNARLGQLEQRLIGALGSE